MNIRQQAADQAVQQTTGFFGSKMATGMTVGGGGVTVIGGLTLNEFAIVFGMVVGLLGLCLQVYQTDQRGAAFCSEWCAAAIGFPTPAIYSPRTLGELARWLSTNPWQATSP